MMDYPDKGVIDDKTLLRRVEPHMSGGMTRDEEHPEFVLTDPDGPPRLQQERLPSITVEGHLPHQACGRREIQDRALQRMDVRLQPIGFGHETVPEDMVEVAVGVEQQFGNQTLGGHVGAQLLPLPGCVAAGVYDGAPALIVMDQVGVLLKGVELENFNMKHGLTAMAHNQ